MTPPIDADLIQARTPPRAQGRLRLRCFNTRDREALVRMHRDPRVRELLIDDFSFDRHGHASAFLDRLQGFYAGHPGLGIWAAEHWVTALSPDDPGYRDAEQSLSPAVLARLTQPQPRFVGWFNLMPIPEQPEEVELGCRLVPAVWGSGLVMDGGAQLLDHAFGLLGRDRVWAICHPRHAAVHLRLRMLGFEHEGVRLYEGNPARYFVIDALSWQCERARPLATRRREALRWVQAHDHGQAGASALVDGA